MNSHKVATSVLGLRKGTGRPRSNMERYFLGTHCPWGRLSLALDTGPAWCCRLRRGSATPQRHLGAEQDLDLKERHQRTQKQSWVSNFHF